jgi:hypothetical protein
MKRNLSILALAALAACAQATAQSATNQKWVGVWHAQVDVQQPDTLTLAADTGKLEGTIVLDMLSSEGGVTHVMEREAHVLMDPHLNGNTLSFQVKMEMRDGRTILHNFAVTLTAPGKADIRCINCGTDAPTVVLARDR